MSMHCTTMQGSATARFSVTREQPIAQCSNAMSCLYCCVTEVWISLCASYLVILYSVGQMKQLCPHVYIRKQGLLSSKPWGHSCHILGKLS